jgi:hypothetical protein
VEEDREEEEGEEVEEEQSSKGLPEELPMKVVSREWLRVAAPICRPADHDPGNSKAPTDLHRRGVVPYIEAAYVFLPRNVLVRPQRHAYFLTRG